MRSGHLRLRIFSKFWWFRFFSISWRTTQRQKQQQKQKQKVPSTKYYWNEKENNGYKASSNKASQQLISFRVIKFFNFSTFSILKFPEAKEVKEDWSWASPSGRYNSQLQLRSGLVFLGSLLVTAHWIFLVFCMKLGDQKVRKITRPDFRKKISILRFLAFYGQNGLKSDSLSSYSKMVPPILLILHIQID